MDFDELKEDWNQESEGTINLPASVQDLYGDQSPVVRIRENMKVELVIQLMAILFGATVPFIVEMEPLLTFPFYAFYILLLALTGYFFTKFYLFYDKIGRMEWSTKESLYELYYGAKLNIEVYKSFTYMFVPYGVVLAMFVRINQYYRYSKSAFSGDLFYGFAFSSYLLVFVIILVLIYLATEWWVNRAYGKYVKEVEGIIEEMREEVGGEKE